MNFIERFNVTPAIVLSTIVTTVFSLTTNAADTGAVGGPLPHGSVWRCTLPGIGLFTGAYFGIVDASTYRNFDGKRGSYSYDSKTGVLRLTSGSSKGLAYQRQSEKNFRVLDDKDKITAGNCVWNPVSTIDGKW